MTRTLGLATAAYSIAIVLRPEILARPCGLVGRTESVPAPMRTLIGGIGCRDTALGVAMTLARPGPALRAVTLARIAADVSDAVGFGLLLPDPRARRNAAAVALGWAALCSVALVLDAD